jgi:hypothetical protein
MLPALMAARPLIKYGVLAGIVVFVLAGLFGWGYLEGRADMKEQWDAAIAAQAATSMHEMAVLQTARQKTMAERAVVEQNLNQKIQTLQRKLVAYGKTPTSPCEPPAHSVAVFNAIGGLLSDPERVSSSDSAAGRMDEPPEAGIEITRLLLAYVQAYGDAAGQLATLWHDYESLVNDVRQQYRLESAGNDG